MEINGYYNINTVFGLRTIKITQYMDGKLYGGFSISNYTMDDFDIQFMVMPIEYSNASDIDIDNWDNWYNKYI